jgi:hypothetical protein
MEAFNDSTAGSFSLRDDGSGDLADGLRWWWRIQADSTGDLGGA